MGKYSGLQPLLEGLLEKQLAKRWRARKALEHPWIKSTHAKFDDERSFAARRQLRKSVLYLRSPHPLATCTDLEPYFDDDEDEDEKDDSNDDAVSISESSSSSSSAGNEEAMGSQWPKGACWFF